MTKADFIGGKQIGRAARCTQHICCSIHTVKRTCGHTDKMHASCRFARDTSARLALWKHTPCADCECMADQGIFILDNAPAFNNPLLPILR